MKILFSPAETKKEGGVSAKLEADNFLFPELYTKREEVLHIYNDFIKSSDDESLSQFFGIKDHKKFQKYKEDIFKQPLMKVIERYDGVAFDYLEYEKLEEDEQNYIDQNVIVFSNLFGPLRAGDFGIPEYKLKQGEKIGAFAPEVFYKKHFSKALDELLANETYLDLRAGFYNKFYKPNSPYVTLKFLKDGKVVSHWAKAYRGLILKAMAKNKIENIEQFMGMEVENLSVKEILKKGEHMEIVYTLV